jgi:hypothetical protein
LAFELWSSGLIVVHCRSRYICYVISFGSFAVASRLTLYQHQYPLDMYVPLIAELEAPTARLQLFPVIVNPIIGSVTTTLVRVVFPVLLHKSIGNHISTLPVPPTAVFTSAILVELME